MQIVKPSTLRLIWEFAGRDADFTAGFRDELAVWVRDHVASVRASRDAQHDPRLGERKGGGKMTAKRVGSAAVKPGSVTPSAGGTLSNLVEVERTLALGQAKLIKLLEGRVSTDVCAKLAGAVQAQGDVLRQVRTAAATAREELRLERTPA